MFSPDIEKLIQKQEQVSDLLPSYAWPGGYPLYYIDDSHYELCPHCAQKAKEDEQITITSWAVNWEDEDLYCEECNERIESAYGNNPMLPDKAEWGDLHMGDI